MMRSMSGVTFLRRMMLAFASGLVVFVGAGCSSDSPGALSSSVWPSHISIGHPTEPGTLVGFGGPMMLINDSDHEVTIDDVELIESDGLTLIDWRLRDVGAGLSTGVQEPFPPTDARAEGANVVSASVTRNDEGALLGDTELVIGVRADAAGRATGSSVRVTYSDQGERRTITFPLSIVLCIPRGSVPDGCL